VRLESVRNIIRQDSDKNLSKVAMGFSEFAAATLSKKELTTDNIRKTFKTVDIRD
jgi:hypothetical protein